MTRIAPKAPCLCGSGKKYKACCGARVDNLVDLEAKRWQVLAGELQRRLIDYAESPVWESARQQAMVDFFDEENPETDDYLWDSFIDWFLFDYRPMEKGSQGLISSFLAENKSTLDPRSASLLEGWAEAVISLFEVVDLDGGRGLTVKDLLRSGKYEVTEPGILSRVEKKSLLVTRLLPVGNCHRFFMGATILPPFFKNPLLRMVRNDYHEFLELLGPGTKGGYNRYLREWGFELEAMVDFLAEQLSETAKGKENVPAFNLQGDAQIPELQVFVNEMMANEAHRQWIDLPLAELGGLSPREAMRNSEGSQKVERVLRRMTIHGTGKEVEARYDVKRLKKMLGLTRPEGLPSFAQFSWLEPSHRRVAELLDAEMARHRFTPEQIYSGLQMWHDFAEREKPRINKPGVWAASMIYAMARLELFDYQLTQQYLAGYFQVSAGSVSHNYNRICAALELKPFDSRYSSLEIPLDGMKDLLSLLLQAKSPQ